MKCSAPVAASVEPCQSRAVRTFTAGIVPAPRVGEQGHAPARTVGPTARRVFVLRSREPRLPGGAATPRRPGHPRFQLPPEDPGEVNCYEHTARWAVRAPAEPASSKPLPTATCSRSCRPGTSSLPTTDATRGGCVGSGNPWSKCKGTALGRTRRRPVRARVTRASSGTPAGGSSRGWSPSTGTAYLNRPGPVYVVLRRMKRRLDGGTRPAAHMMVTPVAVRVGGCCTGFGPPA